MDNRVRYKKTSGPKGSSGYGRPAARTTTVCTKAETRRTISQTRQTTVPEAGPARAHSTRRGANPPRITPATATTGLIPNPRTSRLQTPKPSGLHLRPPGGMLAPRRSRIQAPRTIALPTTTAPRGRGFQRTTALPLEAPWMSRMQAPRMIAIPTTTALRAPVSQSPTILPLEAPRVAAPSTPVRNAMMTPRSSTPRPEVSSNARSLNLYMASSEVYTPAPEEPMVPVPVVSSPGSPARNIMVPLSVLRSPRDIIVRVPVPDQTHPSGPSGQAADQDFEEKVRHKLAATERKEKTNLVDKLKEMQDLRRDFVINAIKPLSIYDVFNAGKAITGDVFDARYKALLNQPQTIDDIQFPEEDDTDEDEDFLFAGGTDEAMLSDEQPPLFLESEYQDEDHVADLNMNPMAEWTYDATRGVVQTEPVGIGNVDLPGYAAELFRLVKL